MLTDEQCNEFRRLPVSFNDMVRAIHADGYAQALKDAAEVCETLYAQTGRTFDHRACAAAILALGKEKHITTTEGDAP